MKYGNDPRYICLTEAVVEKYVIDHISAIIDKKLYEFANRQKTEKRLDQTKSILSEMDRLNNIYVKGRLSEAEYDRQYIMLEHKLKKEQNLQAASVDNYTPLKKFFSGNWLDLYKKLDAEHKNAFWKKILQEIKLDSETHKPCEIILLPYYEIPAK